MTRHPESTLRGGTLAAPRSDFTSTQAEGQPGVGEMRPIPGADGYFVRLNPAAEFGAVVLSAPKKRMYGKGWREMSPDARGRVRLPIRGVYHWRSVAGLARNAFGVA